MPFVHRRVRLRLLALGMLLAVVAAGDARAETPRFAHSFVFHQKEGTRSLPPRFETDVVLPRGVEDWRLLVSCETHGKPCRRGMVSLILSFDYARRGQVLAVLRSPSGGGRLPTDSCFEDWSAKATPPTICSVIAGSGWVLDDGRGLERVFFARIENRGAPIPVHVSIDVLDPLE